MFTPVGIDLPEYYEWVRGEAYPKVSPGVPHGRLQAALSTILYLWGHESGIIASENDMNITVAPDDIRRYLPDIHFTSYDTYDAHGSDIPDIQEIAPDLVVEIISPYQSLPYLNEKIRAFLVAGSPVVLIVDPDREAIDVHRPDGKSTLSRGERFVDERFPGLVVDVSALFDSLVRRRP